MIGCDPATDISSSQQATPPAAAHDDTVLKGPETMSANPNGCMYPPGTFVSPATLWGLESLVPPLRRSALAVRHCHHRRVAVDGPQLAFPAPSSSSSASDKTAAKTDASEGGERKYCRHGSTTECRYHFATARIGLLGMSVPLLEGNCCPTDTSVLLVSIVGSFFSTPARRGCIPIKTKTKTQHVPKGWLLTGGSDREQGASIRGTSARKRALVSSRQRTHPYPSFQITARGRPLSGRVVLSVGEG